MAKAFYNLGMLVAGFAIAVAMDYGYVKTGAANNPASLFRRTQWMSWLFPAFVFGVNWFLFRSVKPARRLGVCIVLAALLFLIEIALLFTIGAEMHFRFGGTE
jgi:hypothetical protein